MAREAARRASSTWSWASRSSSAPLAGVGQQDLDGLDGRVHRVGQGHGLGLHRIGRGQAQERTELLEGRLEPGLGAHEGLLGLRRLQVGAEDVELAHEAHLEPRFRGLAEAVAALEALARHPHELPLGDHAVEGRRDLHGQALAGELELALLPHAAPLAVAEVEVGGVRAETLEDRLGQDHAHVAGVGQLGHREVARAQGGDGAHRASAPGQPLAGVQEDARVVGVDEVARGEARVPVGAGGRLADLRPRHRIGGVHEGEVRLEGTGDGALQADGGGAGSGSHRGRFIGPADLAVERKLLGLRGLGGRRRGRSGPGWAPARSARSRAEGDRSIASHQSSGGFRPVQTAGSRGPASASLNLPAREPAC